jgi:RNA polymerase sigma factor (sigma-70 family)
MVRGTSDPAKNNRNKFCHLQGFFSDICGIMMIKTMSSAVSNDADLVGESLAGNRDAFGQIVARYQSLICSLAYSATGSLSQSEDLAQETFVTAWRQLPDLREPEKLRGWLCRIVRNLTCDALRKQGREPSHGGEVLEEISAIKSPELQPVEQTISNEEAAILWRSLERIPEAFREPLVLFYRENQSIETVAANLDLSEDAVKQRLSRGRKLLQEEVLAFVEGALKKTSPGKNFTLGVLAALSLTETTTKAAAVGTTIAKVGAAAKMGAAFASAISLLPIIGSFYLNMKASGEDAKSLRERQFAVRNRRILIVSPLLLIILLVGLFDQFSLNTKMFFGAVLPLVYIFVFVLFSKHRRRQIQMEDGIYVEWTRERRKEYFAKLRRNGSRKDMYIYLSLACGSLAELLIEPRYPSGGRYHFYVLVFDPIFILFFCIQAWRSRPR